VDCVEDGLNHKDLKVSETVEGWQGSKVQTFVAAVLVCVCVCVYLMRAELRVAFAMVDKDGDGRITPRELMTVMNGLGFKSDDVLVKQMIARFDADGITSYRTPLRFD